VLRRHVLDPWFPRSLDLDAGGFLCDFDRAWRPDGPHDKLLEFQARQTWVAADAARARPDDPRFRRAAEHGFRWLRDVQWDREAGGWFNRLDRSGRPLRGAVKHAHGTAYAIAACAAVHAATADAAALELAREGFDWLERCARDRRHGGWLGFLARDGSPITAVSPLWPSPTDPISTPVGFKDVNVHSDLLETFLLLGAEAPDPRVEERTAEAVEILCTRFRATDGVLHHTVRPDWTPVPHLTQFGNQLQTAFRLDAAGAVLGDRERLGGVAARLVHEALRLGWDRARGGFFDAGPGTPRSSLGLLRPLAASKSWWPQFEGLKAMVRVLQRDPEDGVCRAGVARVWTYVRRHLLDGRFGGVHAMGLDTLPAWRRGLGLRAAPRRFTRKGSVWKDASHDGRALLYAAGAAPAFDLPPAAAL
jgi:mannobiose 2-epimerase